MSERVWTAEDYEHLATSLRQGDAPLTATHRLIIISALTEAADRARDAERAAKDRSTT